MPFVMVNDQFQVAIPDGLGQQLGLKAGDVLEATVENGALHLRPGVTIDRAAIAAELDALFAAHPVAPEDGGKTEEEIMEEIIEDIAIHRAEQRALGK